MATSLKRPHTIAYTVLAVAFLIGGGLHFHEVNDRVKWEREFCKSRSEAWDLVTRALTRVALDHDDHRALILVQRIPDLNC